MQSSHLSIKQSICFQHDSWSTRLKLTIHEMFLLITEASNCLHLKVSFRKFAVKSLRFSDEWGRKSKRTTLQSQLILPARRLKRVKPFLLMSVCVRWRKAILTQFISQLIISPLLFAQRLVFNNLKGTFPHNESNLSCWQCPKSREEANKAWISCCSQNFHVYLTTDEGFLSPDEIFIKIKKKGWKFSLTEIWQSVLINFLPCLPSTISVEKIGDAFHFRRKWDIPSTSARRSRCFRVAFENEEIFRFESLNWIHSLRFTICE